tara:strand:- start:285 stop:806 length:522 start_codon:yes stop_codon:yes gene_type:complete
MSDLTVLAEQASTTISPFELHGAVSGLMLGAEEDFVILELHSLFDDGNFREQKSLAEFVSATRKSLEAVDLSFSLLLPPEEASLAERAQGLVDWVGAFLAGFGVTLARLGTEFIGDEAQEILDDFAAVTLIDTEEVSLESEEEDAQSDLFQVEEFVKVGVILLSGIVSGEGEA